MMHDAAWHEHQYNPRLTVENAATIIPEWRKRSMLTRELWPPMSDIKYGPHPRENYDLFRPANSKGCLVYIHGGYWRMLSKLETSFVAEDFVAQGTSVALINYPLCPDMTVADIRGSVISAFRHLWHYTLTEAERRSIVVAGHSAGGHLAVHHLAIDWRGFDLPQNPINGVVSLSGIFDLAPLINTSMNQDIRLTEASALPLNLMTAQPKCRAKLVLAVGADEPDEFHRQSQDMAKAWAQLSPEVVALPETNHYSIVDQLALPHGPLHQRVMNMLAATPS